MKTKKTLALAAVAGLVTAGSAIITATPAHAQVKCVGGNSCKGTSACGGKGLKHSCHGHNACAGQGWVNAKDEADCKKKKAAVKAKRDKKRG